MITIADVKEELRIDAVDTSQDALIDKTIKRIHRSIKAYCNNPNINFTDNSDPVNNPIIEELDDVILYLSVMSLNPETRHKAGKQSENQGFSITYIDDLPKYIRKQLIKFKRFTYL